MDAEKYISVSYYRSPFGELILGSFDGDLCLCDWRYRKMRQAVDERIKAGLRAEFKTEETPVIKATIQQLEAYFEGKRKDFEIPVRFVGSDFQKRVWNASLNIPFGETITYLDLAKSLGDEKSIRAAASANGANAISIIVPCHRVVGQNGKLTGYAGGLDTKRRLLLLESKGLHKNELPLFD
ncbi:methylated-DNA--[protein]-cysteine S-methyltransferase [Saccharicrinis sp. FJH2]|uniref:methylated-DNA--[protein]-cysteine S-methyltransferase n=1 Tax=Saccharicrinis sp. FJH65 TaxID=3344659 RepID=UPI0035F36EF8